MWYTSCISAVRTSATFFPSVPFPTSADTKMIPLSLSLLQRCCYSKTRPALLGLEEFRDSVSAEVRQKESVGRSWTVQELRRKSFDDLHKLWLVLYKERNMLLTENNLCRRKSIPFPQADRRQKVKKSMGAIKAVLGERKRDKIAQHALKMAQLHNVDDADDVDDDGKEILTQGQTRAPISNNTS